jgi:hypothetical protein
MTEDLQPGAPAVTVFRLCRHTYAGTLHLTNLWWSDNEDDVLGTDALSEHQWLDVHGRPRLRVSMGAPPPRMRVLSSDARQCLAPLTSYRQEQIGPPAVLVRQIDEEVAREAEAITAAKRGIAFADAWLAVLESTDLSQAWRGEMSRRGFSGDTALDSPYHSAMPTHLTMQARKNWEAAHANATTRHAALMEEWAALRASEPIASQDAP